MANEDRIRQVVAAIEAEPDHFDMNTFINWCGTTFCFAGWALKLAGEDMEFWRNRYWSGSDAAVAGIEDRACEWLELPLSQGSRLFYSLAVWNVASLKLLITEELGIEFPVEVS